MSSKRKQFSVSECFNRKTAKTNEIQSNECDFKHKLKTLIATNDSTIEYKPIDYNLFSFDFLNKYILKHIILNVRKTGKPDRNENLGLRTGQEFPFSTLSITSSNNLLNHKFSVPFFLNS